MPGGPLSLDESFGRYCKPSQVFEDGHVASTAFILRAGEDYLSGGCLEKYPGGALEPQLTALRDNYARVLRFKSKSKFAILKVSRTIEQVEKDSGRKIRFLHEPEPDHYAHSGIHDTKENEETIAELIARSVDYTIPAIP